MFSLTRNRRAEERSPKLRNFYFRATGLRHRARLRGSLENGEQSTDLNPENIVWTFCTARSGSACGVQQRKGRTRPLPYSPNIEFGLECLRGGEVG